MHCRFEQLNWSNAHLTGSEITATIPSVPATLIYTFCVTLPHCTYSHCRTCLKNTNRGTHTLLSLAYMHMRTHTHTNTHTHACTHRHMHIQACTHTRTGMHVHTYIHTYTHTLTTATVNPFISSITAVGVSITLPLFRDTPS